MKFYSTRDKSKIVTGAEAVLCGISPDGGLFVPCEFPSLDYKSLLKHSYGSLLESVLSCFFDFGIEGIGELSEQTFDGECAPVIKLDNDIYILELWHGRTCAFKDIALSVLPHLIQRAKAKLNDKSKTLILVATSGDTGKAALEGFKDVEGVEIACFYPTDGVSKVQKAAMQSQSGGNVYVAGISGNFDDAQTAVKKAFTDTELVKKLADNNVKFSSANSINVGRLIPQIAYYYSAYCDLVNSGQIEEGDKVNFVVPTGNFGNILAGYYAKKMGLPVGRLICASNDNKVLSDFIRSGTYDVNRPFYKTDSPSMDILISSNLERLVFELCGRDDKAVNSYFADLKKQGRYSITAKQLRELNDLIDGGYTGADAVLKNIKSTFDEYGYLLDTHTAVAYDLASRLGIHAPTVIISTANPYKFAPAICKALGIRYDTEERAFSQIEDHTAMPPPQALLDILKAKIIYNDVIDANDINTLILKRYA